jgi:hypothetical protein
MLKKETSEKHINKNLQKPKQIATKKIRMKFDLKKNIRRMKFEKKKLC